MTDEERRQIAISLASLIHKLGWEELIEIKITPEDAERGEVDPYLVRLLVAQLSKVVRDLGAVEADLLSRGDVRTIVFEPDSQELGATDEPASRRFERGLLLDRDQVQARHKTFSDLQKTLLGLEGAFVVD